MMYVSTIITLLGVCDRQPEKEVECIEKLKNHIRLFFSSCSSIKNRRNLIMKSMIQKFGLLGVVSLLSYTAAVIFAPLTYPGYNWMAQAVSDLSANNAPSKMLWEQLSSLYGVCGMISIMMVCVFIQGKLNKPLRIGIYLFAIMNWVYVEAFQIDLVKLMVCHEKSPRYSYKAHK